MLNGLIRWAVVVGIGLVTAWPDFGIAALSWRWFPLAPLPIVIFDLVWVIVLALALPLPIRTFHWVTILAVVLICTGALYLSYVNYAGVVMAWPWFMWLVLIASFALGWWKISTPLWRWANGIVVVQHTAEDHDVNDHYQ